MKLNSQHLSALRILSAYALYFLKKGKIKTNVIVVDLDLYERIEGIETSRNDSFAV
jgi:hypothetical protein